MAGSVTAAMREATPAAAHNVQELDLKSSSREMIGAAAAGNQYLLPR
jgi:hypothetical protein